MIAWPMKARPETLKAIFPYLLGKASAAAPLSTYERKERSFHFTRGKKVRSLQARHYHFGGGPAESGEANAEFSGEGAPDVCPG